MNERVDPKAEDKAEPVEVTKAPDVETGTVETTALEAPTRRRGSRRLILMVAVPLVLLVAGGYFWLTGGRYENTDNAYVAQSIVSISPDISGRIVEVDVAENQTVQAGDTLFKIDPEPYQIAVDQAQAALASARINVEKMRVGYTTAQAQLNAAQQTLEIKQRAQDRSTSLAQQGVTTEAATDNTLLALQQAQSQVDLAQQNVNGAVAALAGDPDIATDEHPAVRAALSALDNARRNLEKTTVTAPGAGVVSQVGSLNVGQFVGAGSMVASIVETGDSWVIVNFKETQLGKMQVGQSAEVSIDAYPGVSFAGNVASIGAATGSEFSLIPAQNATGNWVKVVQRIPVRIDLDAAPEQAMRAGMSAEVTVDTGHSRLDMFGN